MNEVLLGGWSAPPVLLFTVFMLSQWGWWCFFGKHCSVNVLFLPSLAACFQITFLVCAGMAGSILYGTYGLFLFGVVYLLYSFVRKGYSFKMISAVEVLFLLCMIALIYYVVDGKILRHPDDYHHWGVVVNELLRTDCFPDKSRYLTIHFTYPLGSAVWIYNVCRSLFANSESAWMFAQALLMTYCVLPLFSFLPKCSRNIASWINVALYFLFVVLLENCLLSYCTQIYTLLVDSLLPLVGVAASMFAFFVDDSREGQKPKTEANILCLAAYFGAIIQIKTSGVFFVIAVASILVLKKSIREDKHRLILTGVSLFFSFVPLLFWKLYCANHFAGMTAKHEGSFSSFIRLFAEKSPEDINKICLGVMKYFLTSSYLIEMVAVLGAIFILTMVLANDSDTMRAAKCWAYMLVSYLAYSISTAAMYVCSMPLREARNLASNYRYQKTMMIFCYYILFATLLYVLSNTTLVVVPRGNTPTKTTAIGNSTLQRTTGVLLFRPAPPSEEQKMESRIQWTRVCSLLLAFVLLIGGWTHIHRGRFITMSSNYEGDFLTQRINCQTALKEAEVPDMAKCLVLMTKQKEIDETMLVLLLGSDRHNIDKIVVENSDQMQKADDALEDGWWVLIADDENELIRSWRGQKNDPHIVSVA